MAGGKTDIPQGPVITVTPKNNAKKISYIWMPDKNGNLVKADASKVKKSFAKRSDPTGAPVTAAPSIFIEVIIAA
jgi:hypothetical protein